MRVFALVAASVFAATAALAAAPGSNGRLAFETPVDTTTQIATVDAEGSGRRVLTAAENGAFAPAWGPGGLKIAYVADGAIDIVDLASGETSALLEASGFALSSPAWSADASKLAFIGEDLATGQFDLWTANADGTGLMNLTDDSAVDAEPVWTPDGSKLLFATDRDGNFEIYQIDADGQNATNLTNDVDDDRDPDVSPDGAMVVFVRIVPEADPAIWVMNADGSSPMALTDGTFPAVDPAWSPDGALLALAGAPEEDFEIWTAAADGTGLALVAGGEGDQRRPAWQAIVAGDNLPPAADAGMGGDVECTSPSGAQVTLDGSASSDPDDTAEMSDIVLYEWFEDFGTENEALLGLGATLVVPFGFGEHLVTLQVTDSVGQTATAEVVWVVGDTTAPVIELVASPSMIWPPNHKMVHVHVEAIASDVCSPPVTVLLESVTSSEPDDANGDGRTQPDILGVESGTPDFDFQVRAERSGRGTGRVYTATYSATDALGNVGLGDVTITVPHDQRGMRDHLSDPTRKLKNDKASRRSTSGRR